MAKKKSTSKKSSTRSANARAKTTRGGTSRRSKSRRSGSKSTRSRSSSKRSKRRKKPSAQEQRQKFLRKVLIAGMVVFFLSVLLILSLIIPNQGDLTLGLSNLLWQAFGWGGLLVPFITGGVGFYLVLWGMEQPPRLPVRRLSGFGLLYLVLISLASLIAVTRNLEFVTVWDVARAGSGGGYLGGFVAFGLTQLIGNLGAISLLILLGLAGGVLLSGVTRTDVTLFWEGVQEARRRAAAQRAAEREIPINPGSGRAQTIRTAAPTQLELMPEEETAVSPATSSPPEAAPAADAAPTRRRARPATTETAPEPAAPAPILYGRHQAHYNWDLPAVNDILEEGGDQDLNSASIREQVEVIEHTLESFGAPATVVEINQGPTITQFGVEPNFLESRSGKRTKVKVGKIASLADDIALALAAHSIRIQAPVPGKGYVGIEVPNVAKALVSLRDVMESNEFGKIKSPLSIGLGQNVSGQAIATDLTKMPHLLIAGTTGSGKSVCVNSIIACLLLRNTPDQLKIVMVDPKRVELTGYNGIPHLAAPVVVEMDRVIGTMQWALREMDHRYKLFADVGARNITDYNAKIKRMEDKESLPYIVIIIDELADLMMLAPEDTERSVTRLAQMARATGIHMIIATQRPSVDVVTGLIKANFPARVAFAVASSTDSRVILDTAGAERLLGQGDMLFQSPDAAAPVRLQGCFVSDEELSKLIEYWRRARRFNLIPAQESTTSRLEAPATTPANAPAAARPQNGRSPAPPAAPASPPAAKPDAPDAEPDAPAPPPQVNVRRKRQAKKKEPEQRPLWEELEAMEEEADELPELEDELLPEAIALVRKLNKASTSLLQRRFRIGYTRAARLMDYMEDHQIIGPPTGTSKARKVLPWAHAGDASPSADQPETTP